MTRDQALTVTRYWLARQPPLFRGRWAVRGPAAVIRHWYPSENDAENEGADLSAYVLERLLDINRDLLMGRIDEAGSNEALEVLAAELEGDISHAKAEIDCQLIGLAVHLVRSRQETKDWPPYAVADTVWQLLEDTDMRPILVQALEGVKRSPLVRESIEEAIGQLNKP
jgi:hypothetical protein